MNNFINLFFKCNGNSRKKHVNLAVRIISVNLIQIEKIYLVDADTQ